MIKFEKKIICLKTKYNYNPKIPSSVKARFKTVVASKWAKVVAGAGSVKSSAGT